jgi:hypothetical protein
MQEQARRIFISSTFRDDFGSGLEAVSIRAKLRETALTYGVDAWTYEHQGWDEAALDADTIIDRCFSGIKVCSVFAFVLTGRHGSRAGLIDDGAFASYLELELFAAAALRKPVVILHYANREPDPALVDALGLLQKSFGPTQYWLDTEAGLLRRWKRFCRRLAKDRRLPAAPANDLAHGLSLRRARSHPLRDIDDPMLHFLGGNFATSRGAPDLDRAGRLLQQVARGVRGDGVGAAAMPHGAALFRIWAAIRELANKDATSLVEPAAAGLWDQAFGLWAAKASWFGLHGHLWMSPLAAVNSQTALRQRMTKEIAFRAAHDVREPLGARASALYSIGHRMRSLSRKAFHYEQAGLLATRAMERDPDARRGLLAIRGNVHLRMAWLLRPWRIRDAERDFAEALQLRAAAGAPQAQLGEMKVDLGLCRVLAGRRRSGLALAREGVEDLRSDMSVNGRSFLARGLRKLRWAEFASLNLAASRRSAEEASRIAAEVEALDQARDG